MQRKEKRFIDRHLKRGSKVLCLIAKHPDTKPKCIWQVEKHFSSIEVVAAKNQGVYITDDGFEIGWKHIYPVAINRLGQIEYLGNDKHERN